jgi:hypothetical protein
MLATTLAFAALAISGLTFVLSYRATTAAERRSRLPVLVFVYDLDPGVAAAQCRLRSGAQHRDSPAAHHRD